MRFDANLSEQVTPVSGFTGTGSVVAPMCSVSGTGTVSGGTAQIGGAVARYHPGRRIIHRTPVYTAPPTPLRPPLRPPPQPITGVGNITAPACSCYGEGNARLPLAQILADDEAVLEYLMLHRPVFTPDPTVHRIQF